jgi:hypothetical protein
MPMHPAVVLGSRLNVDDAMSDHDLRLEYQGETLLARSVRAGLVAVLAAAAGVVTCSSEAQAQPAAFPKVYMTTVVTQWSHWTPDTNDSSHAGTLYAASNYFYCRTTGQYYNNNGHGTWCG